MSEADLGEHLQSVLVTGDDAVDQPTAPAVDRILDAATRRFTEVGVAATTMSSIAAEADLSREWLYRHFPNRDAVVVGVLQRELRRFVDGLAVRASDRDDVIDALTDAFVYSVEFLRDEHVLGSVLDRDVHLGAAEVRSHAGSLVGAAVRTCAGYLVDRGGKDPSTAVAIAETLTRLVGSTVLAPTGELDLHDPTTLRAYAARIVPAIVRGC